MFALSTHLYQLLELVFSAIELNIEVICVQEHRFYHPVNLSWKQLARLIGLINGKHIFKSYI